MLVLNDVLKPAEGRDLRASLQHLVFADGVKTAGVFARTFDNVRSAANEFDDRK